MITENKLLIAKNDFLFVCIHYIIFHIFFFFYIKTLKEIKMKNQLPFALDFRKKKELLLSSKKKNRYFCKT